jgi:enoyl-CoA hydratase
MNYETLLIEKQGPVALIKMNRPPVNPLNIKLYLEMYDMLCELEKDDSVAALVITGAGEKAFAAGLDVKDVANKTVAEILDFQNTVPKKCFEKLTGIAKPTIAAVFGLALGGGSEIALCCDLRVASTDAVFGLPEINLGIMPGSGATQRLSRMVGASKAKELMFTGDTIGADEAYRIGLVNKVVSREKLMEEAMALANKLAAKPRVALALIKQCVDNGMNMDLVSGLTLERNSFVIAYASEDGREGLSAFIEKRKPTYKGK